MNRPELKKILITAGQNALLEARVREAAADAMVVVTTSDDDILREIADAQMSIGARLKPEHLNAAQQLVWHHVPWVGVESIITPELIAKNIIVTNGSGANAANIAEHVIAMMLAFARDLPRFIRDQDAHHWRAWDDTFEGYFELGSQHVVTLGTGDIAREVALRLKAFGCEVIGASRSGNARPEFDRCVSFDQLSELLSDADHVINCLPLTDDTRGVVDKHLLASIKPKAFFYNVGRGDTVDQSALIHALESGHLRGAGLDVTSPEPLPEDSPLWAMENVIITSHTSGQSPIARQRGAELVAELLHRYQADQPLFNIVDPQAGY